MVFRKVVRRVIGLLDWAGVPYAITGSLAAGYYGLARATRDIDVIVFPDEKGLKRLVEYAKKSGFSPVGRAKSTETKKFTLEAKEGYRVDFWVAQGYGFVVLDRAREMRVFGRRMRMVSPEDLILQKLLVGRPKDIRDAAAVMVRQGENLDVEHLRSWAGELGVADAFNWLVKKVW
jgi:predicted nucleotidyltransferase